MTILKETKSIIFNFRYDDDKVVKAPYQLVVSRADGPVNNTLLFHQLYLLLQTVYKQNRSKVYFSDLKPILEYHYWNFSIRFSFVNEFTDQYEQAKKENRLTSREINLFLDYWLEEKCLNSAIYEGSVRLSALADEETAFRLDVPIGTPYTYIPEPSNNLEAFQRLKFLMGPQVCEYLIRKFDQNYTEPTAEIYISELAPIKAFVENINYTELKEAFKCRDNNHEREYLRIVHGYYENHCCDQAMGSTASMVYGTYILYKKWLEDRLRESLHERKAPGLPQLEPGKVSSDFVLGQELFSQLYKRGLLSDFFLVPAPPVKGRFWYDLNDRDTDDPAKVVRTSPITISQNRRATANDFETVLDQVNIISNKNSKAYSHFVEDLITCLQQMIGFHRTLYKPEERDENHYSLIELAQEFISWIQNDHLLAKVAAEKKEVIGAEVTQPLPLQVIAMLCYYKGEIVTRRNSQEITQRYNPHQKGDKLYNHYIRFTKREHRISIGGSETITANKLEKFLKVVSMLANYPVAMDHARRDLEDFKKRNSLD